VFTYKLHGPDGAEIGQATYPSMVKPGELLFFGSGREFRVLAVTAIEDDASPFVGTLQVEAIGFLRSPEG
jgi:hypothetical protein